MPRIGVPELLIILAILLLIFGAGKLPEISASIGKAIRTFRRSASVDDEAKRASRTLAQQKRGDNTSSH